MNRLHLSGATGPTYDACGAVQTKFVIEPGAEQTVYILLGCENSRESAVQLAQKYRQARCLRTSTRGSTQVLGRCARYDYRFDTIALRWTLC